MHIEKLAINNTISAYNETTSTLQLKEISQPGLTDLNTQALRPRDRKKLKKKIPSPSHLI